jgi:hypothetical protein
MNTTIYIIIIFTILLLLFYFGIMYFSKSTNFSKISYEHFFENFNVNNIENNTNITTWKPYIIDKYFQPGYSNYFYRNGYMYPIY